MSKDENPAKANAESLQPDELENQKSSEEHADTAKATKKTAASKAVEAVEETEEKAEQQYAKAGKKSRKHQAEVQEEAERQAKKEERDGTEEKKAGPKPKTRPRLERRGKKYQAAYKLIDRKKTYTLEEAIELAAKTSPVNFDASVELHFRLGVDPRQADQNIRATVVLPEGTGKVRRVAVFAPLDEAKRAKEAGADIAEDEAFLKRLEKNQLDFDVLISTPAFMPKLGRYARTLGPKGLMPNPKAGTVTNDVEKAVAEAKAGKIEYRVDKQAIVHVAIGKVSFGQARLLKNANTFINNLKTQKPASLKGQFVKSAFMTTSMGPSIALENIYG